MQQYVENYLEKEQLGYMRLETANWPKRVAPVKTDKYMMLAAWNIVNCIAFVPPKTKKYQRMFYPL